MLLQGKKIINKFRSKIFWIKNTRIQEPEQEPEQAPEPNKEKNCVKNL